MRLGIHRTLLRTSKNRLLFYLIGLLSGIALCALSARLLLRGELAPSLLLPLVFLGVGAAVCFGILLVQLLRWLRRATWVLQSVEPQAMRLSLHVSPPQRFGCTAVPLVTLKPIHASSRISPKTDLPVFYPVRRHRRKGYYERHKVTVAVFADPRRGGPLVIRMEGRLFCSQPHPQQTSCPLLHRLCDSSKHAERVSPLTTTVDQ